MSVSITILWVILGLHLVELLGICAGLIMLSYIVAMPLHSFYYAIKRSLNGGI